MKLGFSPQTKDDEDVVKSAPQHVAAMEEAYKTLLVQAWSILEKHRAEAAACAKKAKGEAALCDYELVHKLEADPECKLQEEDLRLFFEPFRARVGGAPASAAAGATSGAAPQKPPPPPTPFADAKDFPAIMTKLGCKFEPAKPEESNKFTSYLLTGADKNQSPCFVYYYDFAKHPAADVGPRRVVTVTPSNEGSKVAPAVLTLLRQRNAANTKDVEAALANDGWTIKAAPKTLPQSSQTHPVGVQKGDEYVTVDVLDFGWIIDKLPPVGKSNPTLMAHDGSRFLFVTFKDPAPALAAFLKK